METTTTIKKTTKNNLGIVFGHNPSDMAHAIKALKDKDLEVWVITWDRYSDIFVDVQTYSQKTPENQGMDCLNLVHKSAELMFDKIKNRKVEAIANCHTIPTIWDFDLTTKEWKELFAFEPTEKDYADDLIRTRYTQLYGTKD